MTDLNTYKYISILDVMNGKHTIDDYMNFIKKRYGHRFSTEEEIETVRRFILWNVKVYKMIERIEKEKVSPEEVDVVRKYLEIGEKTFLEDRNNSKAIFKVFSGIERGIVITLRYLLAVSCIKKAIELEIEALEDYEKYLDKLSL